MTPQFTRIAYRRRKEYHLDFYLLWAKWTKKTFGVYHYYEEGHQRFMTKRVRIKNQQGSIRFFKRC